MPSAVRRPAPVRAVAAVATAGLLAAGALWAPARSATPEGGTVGPQSPEVRWSGAVTGQTAGFSGVGCTLAENDPTCDSYTLTIEDLTPAPTTTTTTLKKPKKSATPPPPAGPVLDDVQIAVASRPSAEGLIAEFDLYVHDASGQEVARSTNIGDDELVLDQPAPGTYTVYVQSPLSVDPSATYDAVARLHDSSGDPVDIEASDCGLEGAPPGVIPEDEPIGAGPLVGDPTAVTDGIDRDQEIFLDVALVLDGVSVFDGEELVKAAAPSYKPLNIVLRVDSVYTLSIATDDALAIIRGAKDLLHGHRPAGADLVAVLTSKDIQQLGQTAIAGLADCIGGVAHSDRAFLVAEAYGAQNYDIGVPGVIFGANARANVLAHEAGHLMGGQHHYANCAEGVAETDRHPDGTVEVSPCTLMFNAADFLGSNFDTVNGAVVRGSAVRYAHQP